MTPAALELLVEAGLDGMNVDMKGGAAAVRRHCKGIDVEKVWSICRLARKHGVHLEITTLVIPGVNDDRASSRGMAERIVADLGPDVPWHVTAYYPAYRFNAPPTSVSVLERAWAIGKEAGLGFVYLGNVPGHPSDNTTCPSCAMLLIERCGLAVLQNNLEDGRCPRCRTAIPGVWSPRQPGAIGRSRRQTARIS
jgi:pyruvate formate lyase activating enzyme